MVKGKAMVKGKKHIAARPAQPSPHCSSGIAGLDGMLGGGFPKDSVILLSGPPGSGKTILAFQWIFEGVRKKENCVYITVTEPLFKSLKNIESMDFYDRKAVESGQLRIIDLRDISKGDSFDHERTIDFIEKEVVDLNAKRLCIDSVTAIAYSLDDKAKIRKFIYELGQTLATLGCTTVLTSEVSEDGRLSAYGVEEFISDVIIRLDQLERANGFSRRMLISKVRGRGYSADFLPFRIKPEGIVIYPKFKATLSYPSTGERLSTGVITLDEMLQGGLFRGSLTSIIGSSGTGKSLFGLQFLKEGLEKGEPCLYAGFEESADQVIRNAKGFGWDIEKFVKSGLLTLRCAYPGEMAMDEHMAEIKRIVETKAIKRCALDSLSSISTSFPHEEFVSFVMLLCQYLRAKSVTGMLTAAVVDSRLRQASESHTSVLYDNIIMLRNVEMEGELRPVMNIIKMRGSAHSKGLRRYDITGTGIAIGQPMVGYEGITTGVSRRVSETLDERLENEFRKALGPMGSQVYREMAAKGFTEEGLSSYIDSLEKDGIMSAGDAADFWERIEIILRGTEHPARKGRGGKGGNIIGRMLGGQ